MNETVDASSSSEKPQSWFEIDNNLRELKCPDVDEAGERLLYACDAFIEGMNMYANEMQKKVSTDELGLDEDQKSALQNILTKIFEAAEKYFKLSKFDLNDSNIVYTEITIRLDVYRRALLEAINEVVV